VLKIKIHAKRFPSKLRVAMMAMCHHAFKELGVSDRIKNSMTLNIHLRHHVSEGEAYLADEANVYRPKEFVVILDHHRILIDDYGREKGDLEWAHDMLKILAHELVHVKDYVLGNLAMRKVGMVYRGVTFDAETLLDYFKLPYEIEAYGREKGLLVSFLIFWNSIESELGLLGDDEIDE